MNTYNKTDQQLHFLSQILAKVSRTFVPEVADDSHTNLSFEPLDFRIHSRWIKTPKGNIILSLNLLNLSYEWQSETKTIIQRVEAVGKLPHEIEKELEFGLKSMGIEETNFSDKLHYEIPTYSFINNPNEAVSPSCIKEWAVRRRMANMVCSELLDYFQKDAEVRIWPHHFDTGFYTSVSSSMNIGFGWAMKDEKANNAYFYMAGYSDNEIDYSNIKDLPAGRWELGDDWKGTILPLTDFETLSFEETQPLIIGFLKASSNWFLRAGS